MSKGENSSNTIARLLIQALHNKLPENEKHSTEIEELSIEHSLFQVQNTKLLIFLNILYNFY